MLQWMLKHSVISSVLFHLRKQSNLKLVMLRRGTFVKRIAFCKAVLLKQPVLVLRQFCGLVSRRSCAWTKISAFWRFSKVWWYLSYKTKIVCWKAHDHTFDLSRETNSQYNEMRTILLTGFFVCLLRYDTRVVYLKCFITLSFSNVQ